MRLNEVRPGQFITVKPSHLADLNGDPPYGTIVDVFVTGKVRVCWANHGCRTHALKSPYMDRFMVESR